MNEDDLSVSPLLKMLKEVGPVAAVFLAVAFNIIVLLNELLGQSSDPNTWRIYAGAAGAGTLAFIIVLVVIYSYENLISKAFNFRVMKEENHYEIERETDRTVKITCKQILVVKALHDTQSKFRLFHPLEEYTPIKFEFPNGLPSKLDLQEIEPNLDGVSVYYPNRKFIKGTSEEIKVSWVYENVPSEKGIMAAIIRRPTAFLKISVSFPAGNRTPQKTGWEMYNLERFPVKAGKAKCTNCGNQYIIVKSFRKTREGFGYTLWWDFQ